MRFRKKAVDVVNSTKVAQMLGPEAVKNGQVGGAAAPPEEKKKRRGTGFGETIRRGLGMAPSPMAAGSPKSARKGK